LKRFLRLFRQLVEELVRLMAVEARRVKFLMRNTVLMTIFGVLGFIALAGLVVMAGWLALSGMAQGLGVLFGDRLWAGDLAAGLLFLAGLGLAMRYALKEHAAPAAKEKRGKPGGPACAGWNVGDPPGCCQPPRPSKTDCGSLAEETHDAKAAMAETLHGMKETLEGMVDVQACTARHPWLLVGSAAAAGFVAGAMWKFVTRCCTPRATKVTQPGPEPSGPGWIATQAKAFLIPLVTSALTRVLQTMIQEAIAAAVPPRNQPESPNVSSGSAASDDWSDDEPSGTA
jgi:hypothetical protein